MEIVLSIVGIVAAILNIILFFKIWGMTTNVSEIKEKIASKSFHRLFVLGRTKEAYEMLLEEMYEKLFEQVMALDNPPYFKKCLKELIEEYSPRFAVLDAEIPDEIKTLTFEKWRKGFA